MDVCFLEQDMNGPRHGVEVPAEKSDETPKYPHRMVLLRREMVNIFKEAELKRWINERAAEQTGTVRPKSEDEPEWHSVARQAQSLGKPNKTRTAAESEQDEAQRQAYQALFGGTRAFVNVEDFYFELNPDAHVDIKGGKTRLTNESEASTLMVRAASIFLRSQGITAFIGDSIESSVVPRDGAELTKQMHQKGLNMRYLGKLAVALETMPNEVLESHRLSAQHFLTKYRVRGFHQQQSFIFC